jgi:hypothetical protein
MARSSGDAPTAVTEESATSGQATPMAEAPANPTQAQEEAQKASQEESQEVPDEEQRPTEAWTVAQIEDWAEKHDVDLSGASNKAEKLARVEDAISDAPSTDVREVAREDAEWRLAHPGEVRTRESNPNVGGESFDYLGAVDQPSLTGIPEEEAQEALQKVQKAASDDDQWRRSNPGRVLGRKSREGVGGESFDYLDVVDQGAHPDHSLLVVPEEEDNASESEEPDDENK